jgi:hypothetical protein
VHWATFDLGLHPWDEPAEILAQRAPAEGAHLVMPRVGVAVEPSRVETVDPWWRAIARAGSEPATARWQRVPTP